MFDTPYPTNYGGVYDVMQRVDYFKSAGYGIDLICLASDRTRILTFESIYINSNHNIFDRVFILPYKNNICFFDRYPVSAKVRAMKPTEELISYVSSVKYNFVFIEHLKTTLFSLLLKKYINTSFYLRMHNNEAEYYAELSLGTKNIFKKFFFFFESKKYIDFQNNILKNGLFDRIYFISERDIVTTGLKKNEINRLLPIYFNMNLLSTNSFFKSEVNHIYNLDFLYVGNLDSDDNVKAAAESLFFLSNLNMKEDVSVIIAGKCNNVKRQKEVNKYLKKIFKFDLLTNISSSELDKLYSRTKLFLNFSKNKGGVKTKLIDALSRNCVCISNYNGVNGSGFNDIVIPAEDKSINLILDLLHDSEKLNAYKSSQLSLITSKSQELNSLYQVEFCR
ncbi:MAG: hypothetical protein HGB36_05355 [Chlorobiaceae bacterium]|nr:hypothetical protein [Chlorobiaceae bacterium]